MWVLDLFQAVFGLIYVLILPGFAATWALFPKKDEIDWIERIALTMVLSLALSVLPVMLWETPRSSQKAPASGKSFGASSWLMGTVATALPPSKIVYGAFVARFGCAGQVADTR